MEHNKFVVSSAFVDLDEAMQMTLSRGRSLQQGIQSSSLFISWHNRVDDAQRITFKCQITDICRARCLQNLYNVVEAAMEAYVNHDIVNYFL